MALGMDNVIAQKRIGGADTDFADKRRNEARYQEQKREIAELREQVQQFIMGVDGKIAQLMAKTEAAQDDRIPDILARIARLETKRGPGRPPKVEAT